MPFDYSSLQQMQRLHPAWRLLRAELAPFIVTFLDKAFVQPNVRTISQEILESQLEDLLYALRQTEGNSAFPRKAKEYLEDWASNEKGWLRMFYPQGSDEPHFDLTPAAEKAIAWLDNLGAKGFVGTESRLRTIFDLLKQIVFGAEANADVRLQELERRKAKIEVQIEAVRRGEFTLMDHVALKERYLQVVTTARDLLGDFRTVEHNFRELDHQVREEIATWEGRKGDLLQQIFGDRDQITDSEQGKSFQAFWDFLMSPASQEEFSTMLDRVATLQQELGGSVDPRFRRIHYDWLEAGEQTQRTVANLSHQLRRYLESQVIMEDRRIIQIIEQIQNHALQVRSQMPIGVFFGIADFGPQIRLPFERALYQPKEQFSFSHAVVNADGQDVDFNVLFSQFYVDKEVLRTQIRAAMKAKIQVSLSDVITQFPLQYGLAELVTYLAIASEDRNAVIDEEQEDHFQWISTDGVSRKAALKRIIFTRNSL
ncbi:MAG TPA: DUF3375 domain-containing protein [Fibrobacteraceae bacterium]|nr:DUF3375 domain-containing protein [Fibrobacteraceae bacterium]